MPKNRRIGPFLRPYGRIAAGGRAARLSAFLLLFLSFASPHLASETWYLEGSWEYYALCDASYRPSLRTASNTVEVYRDLGDGRVIVRSAARMVDSRRGAPLPVQPPPGSESSAERWYGEEGEKSAALAALARSIGGEAATEEEAVDRLSSWVRNKVSYSLGVSTDPLDVARGGRAFCEGYANLTVALMRELGIPAVIASCYIAPGNRWGFGGSGGDHAFVIYFYPGIGWLCLDPQSSSGYVDPYHLIGFSGKVYAQYRQAPDAYVVDYGEEPAAWPSFTAPAKAGKRRGFALRLRDPEGKGASFTARLALAGISLEPSRGYFERNAIGKPWCSMGWEDGIYVRADANRLSATLGGDLGWRSYFALPGAWPDSGREILAAKAGNLLGIRELELDAAAFVVSDFDFARPRSMGLRLRDARGRALAGKRVTLVLDGATEEIETDSGGRLYLSCLDPEGRPRDGLPIRLRIGEEDCAFAYKSGSSLALPDRPALEKALQEALAADRARSSAPRLRLIVRDEAGTADPSLVSRASLFEGAAERRLSAREGGFLEAEGLSASGPWILRACVAGINVERELGPLREGSCSDLEIRLGDLEPAVIGRDNPFDAAPLSLYEYFDDKAGPWPLEGSGGRVLWDCPPGPHLLADNPSRENVIAMDLAPGKELAYSPASMDLEAFRFAAAFKYRVQSPLAGRISDGGGSPRGAAAISAGTLLLVDPRSLSTSPIGLSRAGLFSSRPLSPSADYLLAYVAPGKLLLRGFTTDSSGGALLDLSLAGKGLPCLTSDYRFRGSAETVYLLLASMRKGEPALQACALRPGSRFELYADSGSYLLSTEKTVMGATVLTGSALGRSEGEGPVHLAPDRAEPGFIERSRRAAQAAWPSAAKLRFICFSEREPQDGKTASIEIRLGGRSAGLPPDPLGVVQLSAEEGADCSFRYRRSGLYWEGSCAIEGSGPQVIEISPNASRRVRLSLKGSPPPSLLEPSVRAGRLELGEVPLSADGRGSLAIEAEGRGVWLRARNGAIRSCPLSGGSIAFGEGKDLDQAKAWASLLDERDPEGTHRVLDLRGLGAGLSPRLRDEGGRSLSAWSPQSGIYLLTGLSGASLTMDLQKNGLFLRCSWRLDRGGPVLLLPPSLKSPSLALRLSGPSYKIKNAPVVIHSGGTLEGGKLSGDKEKLYLYASEEGKLVCALPEGLWWVEAGGKLRRLPVKDGGGQAISIAIE